MTDLQTGVKGLVIRMTGAIPNAPFMLVHTATEDVLSAHRSDGSARDMARKLGLLADWSQRAIRPSGRGPEFDARMIEINEILGR